MDYEISIIALISTFYILGLCAFYTEGGGGETLLFAGITCLALIVFCIFNKIKPLLCFILCLIFFAGYFNANVQNKEFDSLSEILSANNTKITGRVYSIPVISKEKKLAKFYLGAQRAELFGQEFILKNTKILVSIYDDKEDYQKIKIGDIIEVKGNLRQPKAASNPSEFDYKKYLKNKDVFCILYSDLTVKNPKKAGYYRVLSHPDIRNVHSFGEKAKEAWWKALQALDLTRDEIIKKHGKYIKSPNLEVFGGIVFGDDAVNPPDEIKQSFINSGLLHLLAASGLNVALIFSIWWMFSGFTYFGQGLGYKARLGFGIILILVYTFMTGFPPSILRASIMLILILAGKLMFKTADNLALIFFTGFIMLLISPKLLNDVGFELSFLVTGGLITCVEPICARFKKQDKTFRREIFKRFKSCPKAISGILSIFSPISLIGMTAVPFIAQLWAAPLQMYYFNTFTPYSVLANIAVVPFIGVISFVGFMSSIVVYAVQNVPLLGGFAADFAARLTSFILNPLISALLFISDYFSKLPGSVIKMPSPGWFQIILYYILILAVICGLKRCKKPVVSACALAFILLLTFIKIPNSNYEIVVFDVGNADNFLIKTPKNKYIMIDTGKLPYRGVSTAKRVSLEYLYDKNIRTLEKLIVTHFDSDHSGGTIDILENINVKEVIIQTRQYDTENSCDIIKYLETHKIPVKIAQSGEVIYKEGGAFEAQTLVPKFPPGAKGLKGEENETSTVVLVKNVQEGGKANYALFMADGGVSTFNALKKQIPSGITVLKAGHHGAKNVVDREMLEYLKPEYTIISTGLNPYGHPNPETMKLLENSGSKIYSTKDFGAIKFSFSPKGSKVSTFMGGSGLGKFAN